MQPTCGRTEGKHRGDWASDWDCNWEALMNSSSADYVGGLLGKLAENNTREVLETTVCTGSYFVYFVYFAYIINQSSHHLIQQWSHQQILHKHFQMEGLRTCQKKLKYWMGSAFNFGPSSLTARARHQKAHPNAPLFEAVFECGSPRFHFDVATLVIKRFGRENDNLSHLEHFLVRQQ